MPGARGRLGCLSVGAIRLGGGLGDKLLERYLASPLYPYIPPAPTPPLQVQACPPPPASADLLDPSRGTNDPPHTRPAGAKLLEQYQAQCVSALRAALAPGVSVSPTLSMAGGSLATTFLESGLAAGGSVGKGAKCDVS